MVENMPFQQTGNTYRLATSTTSANLAVSGTGSIGGIGVFQNTAASICFVAFGTDNTVTASQPSASSSAAVFPVPANGAACISVPPNTAYVAAILPSGATSADLYMTFGRGGA